MKTREKKSLALTLIGHGVVLMAVFLSAAFIHRPPDQVMMVDFGIGGPKSPGGGVPPPPASSNDETPPAPAKPPSKPSQPRENPPPKPVEDKSDFPLKNKKPEPKKPVPPKKTPKSQPAKPELKKTAAKPAVQKSHRLVVRNQAAKPQAKPAAGESASDIRKRMEERLGRANPSAEPGAGGDGTGNATGTSNRFAAYLGGLEEQIQVAWQQPSAAATGLKTEVALILEKSGHLTGIRIVKSSGNVEMDQSALLAVKSIGMYEPWPEDFTSDLAQITVEFECKPNQ